MDLTDTALLAYVHFLVNQGFQFLFLVLNIALAWMLALFCLRWRHTRRVAWLDAYQAWLPVFATSFTLQLVGAMAVLFQAGLLLPDLAGKAGNILGPMVGYGMLLLLLAGLGLAVQLRRRDGSERVRHAAAVGVAIAVSLAAACLLAAESWLQTPRAFEVAGGRFHAADWRAAIFTPSYLPRLTQVFLASGTVVGFLMMGVAAVQALRRRLAPGDEAYFGAALLVVALCVPVQWVAGHASARVMAEAQPAKLAAALAHWETGPAALVLWGWPDAAQRHTAGAREMPGAASWLLTGDAGAPIAGLDEFSRQAPPVAAVFVSARIMTALAVLMLLVAWTTLALQRRRGGGPADLPRWWLRVLAAMTASGWLAALAGWCMAEIGRYPWAVFGLVRVPETFWPIEARILAATLAGYGLAYLLLLAVFGAGVASRLMPRVAEAD